MPWAIAHGLPIRETHGEEEIYPVSYWRYAASGRFDCEIRDEDSPIIACVLEIGGA